MGVVELFAIPEKKKWGGAFSFFPKFTPKHNGPPTPPALSEPTYCIVLHGTVQYIVNYRQGNKGQKTALGEVGVGVRVIASKKRVSSSAFDVLWYSTVRIRTSSIILCGVSVAM